MSHSAAQMLWSEGEGVWGLARPGGTRHQDTRQGGRPPGSGRQGCGPVPAPGCRLLSCLVHPRNGVGQRRNVVWDFSVWACVVSGVPR